MTNTCTHSIAVHNQVDPTRTTSLRNAFDAAMKRKFVELLVAIKKAVGTNDVFGLNPVTFQVFKLYTPEPGAFAFATSADKVKAFMKWIQEQIDKGLLEVQIAEQLGSSINAAWMNMYVYDSYKRGVIRARYELIKAGYDVPTIEESGGIETVMRNPFHMDRVGLLYIRVYNELKGITDAMSQIISRVLSQGMLDGDGPALLARKLVASISGKGVGELGLTDSLGRYISPMRRASLLARTEVIRAHAEAQLQEFKNWRVLEIMAEVEFSSANDDRTCSRCLHLEGKIFTIEDASGIIPVHPLCRCCWLPAIKELEKYK